MKKVYMSKNGPISWPEQVEKYEALREKILKELERRGKKEICNA